jgi:hypothetical protein
MTGMELKRLPLVLPADLYSRLEEQARREDRDPGQQARFILRRVLEEEPRPREQAERR